MESLESEYKKAVAELERQGLQVTLHSRENNTWYVRDGGPFSGHIATGDELLRLQSEKNLNIQGLRRLG